MKITEHELKQQLQELYRYHFKIAKCASEKPMTGKNLQTFMKADGAVEALEAVHLLCFGGKETFKLWNDTAQLGLMLRDDDEKSGAFEVTNEFTT